MKEKLTPKWFVITLTGVFFAAYAAYNIFIILRDLRRGLSLTAIFISAVVALLFSLLSGFALTSGVKNMRFVVIRRMVLIVTLLVIFLLKLRMISAVIAYIDFTKTYTVLYSASYLATQAAMLILFVYYAYIIKSLLQYPKASFILPLSAALLFLCALVIDTILFFGFHVNLEANLIRTVVMRPVFYLGFIGLCVYFLFPRSHTVTEQGGPPELML